MWECFIVFGAGTLCHCMGILSLNECENDLSDSFASSSFVPSDALQISCHLVLIDSIFLHQELFLSLLPTPLQTLFHEHHSPGELFALHTSFDLFPLPFPRAAMPPVSSPSCLYA